ncbi:hypothetical protein HQN89_21880 [Paenibacillus frigoriresistens]|uniref:hypothetical protein n=1 Tax=Paenibacillus alginolyticus TaxID=59839 RepID=UPI001566F86E|nr:hypothetical protein [Paenibacillus frigoriresistens]NRF93597.1 hypothetical protein [Paenibacillus frigoriresistens]
MSYDRIVEKAYHNVLERNDNSDLQALKTLDEFHKRIEEWDGQSMDELSFVSDYLVGAHMNQIIAKGATSAGTEQFIHLISKESNIQNKIAELFRIRKSGPLESNLVHRINDVRFVQTILNHPNLVGASPEQYTHRFFCCIFIEIMTAIAKRSQLNKTAEILEIKSPKELSFTHLQIQVQGRVRESLKRLGLEKEFNQLDTFRKSVVAYHIVDAHKFSTVKPRFC